MDKLTTNNVVQLGINPNTRIAPVTMENIINLDNFSQSAQLYCIMHGYAYCFANLLKALPQSPLIDNVWEKEMQPNVATDLIDDKQRRFSESFTELFFQLKYKLFSETAVVPEVFHRRPDLICDDKTEAPLAYWLSGIVSALSLTKQVPKLWMTDVASDYGEILLNGMTKTVNEFCDRHGINKQFAVDIVFNKFQIVVDRAYYSNKES